MSFVSITLREDQMINMSKTITKFPDTVKGIVELTKPGAPIVRKWTDSDSSWTVADSIAALSVSDEGEGIPATKNDATFKDVSEAGHELILGVTRGPESWQDIVVKLANTVRLDKG